MKLGLSLGFGRPSSGGGYYITIPGAVGGLFDEATGEIGAIATASTNLPDIGNGLTWSMVAGSDADISIHATTGVISSARAIYDGDSATFSLRVENGEVGVDEGAIAIEAPFEAVGTVESWATPGALIDIDYENDRAYVAGTYYDTVSAARTAAAIVQTGGIDRIATTGLGSDYVLAGKGVTAASGLTNPRYLVALDDGADGSPADHLVYLGQYNPIPVKLTGNIQTASSAQTSTAWDTATGAGNSTAVRMAARIKANDSAISFNGAAVVADASVTIPTVTQLVVGNRDDGLRPWQGTIHRIVLINASVSDANLPGILA